MGFKPVCTNACLMTTTASPEILGDADEWLLTGVVLFCIGLVLASFDVLPGIGFLFGVLSGAFLVVGILLWVRERGRGRH